MPRPPRIFIPDGIYHVTVRGNNRQGVFPSAGDYQHYLLELQRALHAYSCELFAYALMPNHIHLVLKDHQASLSRFMQVLNARYTRYINQRYDRVGHLYQGRFYAKFVDRDAYLLEVTRYVHLNPVRAHLVKQPEDHLWSSYRTYIGLEPEQYFVKTQLTWSLMGGEVAQQPGRYRDFVQAMTPEQLPRWESRLRRLHLIGSTRFARQVSDTSPALTSV